MKYLLFVGAGAEFAYKLPSGSAYTEKSLLVKREYLYKQLSSFYKSRVTTDYCKPHEGQYLFSKNNAVFRSIIQEAVWRLAFESKKNSERESIDCRLKELIDFIRTFPIADDISTVQLSEEQLTSLNQKGKSFIDECLDSIIFVEGKSDKAQSGFNALKNEFRYHGKVEQYFSTIINPKTIGPNNFWKLINYFWSAFFTILLPILDNSEYADIDEYKKNRYQYVLNNMNSIINLIYSEDFISEYEANIDGDYYKVLADQLRPDYVATTNYTPFVSLLGCKEENTSFLAGELRYFEDPTRFEVAPYSEFKEDDFVFPFLMTQAPVKPIVSTYQLENYAKFLNHLKEVEVVVILGFSLCEEDNHINALLHGFLKKSGHHLIFCEYVSEEKTFKEKECLASVIKKLHFRSDDEVNIHIIENRGNPEELVKRIQAKFDELAVIGVNIKKAIGNTSILKEASP